MPPVLVETSVWIRIQKNRLKLHDHVERGDLLATCPMVVHEVLRGARDEFVFDMLKAMLDSVVMLDATIPLLRFVEAARIYRRCRAAGVTPSTPDCVIAATAIAYDAHLFQLDHDYAHMARVIPELQLLPVVDS